MQNEKGETCGDTLAGIGALLVMGGAVVYILGKLPLGDYSDAFGKYVSGVGKGCFLSGVATYALGGIARLFTSDAVKQSSDEPNHSSEDTSSSCSRGECDGCIYASNHPNCPKYP